MRSAGQAWTATEAIRLPRENKQAHDSQHRSEEERQCQGQYNRPGRLTGRWEGAYRFDFCNQRLSHEADFGGKPARGGPRTIDLRIEAQRRLVKSTIEHRNGLSQRFDRSPERLWGVLLAVMAPIMGGVGHVEEIPRRQKPARRNGKSAVIDT